MIVQSQGKRRHYSFKNKAKPKTYANVLSQSRQEGGQRRGITSVSHLFVVTYRRLVFLSWEKNPRLDSVLSILEGGGSQHLWKQREAGRGDRMIRRTSVMIENLGGQNLYTYKGCDLTLRNLGLVEGSAKG